MRDYELNEQDIDSVIRYLKVHDPKNATPEMAMALLEHMRAAFHTMAHDNPEMLDEIYQDLKKQKKSKRKNV